MPTKGYRNVTPGADSLFVISSCYRSGRDREGQGWLLLLPLTGLDRIEELPVQVTSANPSCPCAATEGMAVVASCRAASLLFFAVACARAPAPPRASAVGEPVADACVSNCDAMCRQTATARSELRPSCLAQCFDTCQCDQLAFDGHCRCAANRAIFTGEPVPEACVAGQSGPAIPVLASPDVAGF